MKKSVSLEELQDFKNNYCDKFFPQNLSTWSDVVLLECMDDYELMQEVKKYISIRNDSITAEQLNDRMQKLRDKVNECMTKTNSSHSKKEFYEYFTKGLVYYGVLESLDELASFSTELIEAIKDKYKEKYLEVIAEFDKGNLSVDGGKVLESTSLEKVYLEDELLKKYKVLKEWQDKQHGYYQTVIEPILNKMAEDYAEMYPNTMNVSFPSPVMQKKFSELSRKRILSIEEIAKCILAGMKDSLVKLVGGKAYGLATLASYGITIPQTHVIPVTTEHIKQDDLEVLSKETNFSVRSSADIEDGKHNSFAGMFDSYLDVDFNSLEENIQKVIESRNNSRLQKYIERNQLSQPNMAVVIQDFVEPEYAGVWIGKDQNSGYLEYVEGNGEKLVSGKVTPQREIWETGKTPVECLMCAEGNVGELLLRYQKEVAKENKTADFEWMILHNHLVMLQYRPVTSSLNLDTVIQEDEENVYYGIPASPGIASGPARFINAKLINQVTDWKDGDILMAWFTDPEWMDILSHSSAIVTAVGGFLCHAAIIARELGIPCVIGIGGEAMKKIWNEKELSVDGNKGTVSTYVKKKQLNK